MTKEIKIVFIFLILENFIIWFILNYLRLHRLVMTRNAIEKNINTYMKEEIKILHLKRKRCGLQYVFLNY